ncbi:hypothetical protein B1694_15570 [Geobacillus zalihae]|jgi:hypothetical protein|uniref:Uncharacterized protein n=1 Tax=Geobacillus thermodenitrificans TaxID=33940 RepID=A0ABY9QD22_GEOTD|nr:hypothetical protein [Geobacillus thermodenitrificans]OQP18909.1 hypothetical protein B1694_15570 [Geobacillus zalihae]WMV76456.1 hypothetical protein HSX42_01040 [Geobacillus thermodenitrificans]
MILAKKQPFFHQVRGLNGRGIASYGRFLYQKGFGRLTKKDDKSIDWAFVVWGQRYVNCNGACTEREWLSWRSN